MKRSIPFFAAALVFLARTGASAATLAPLNNLETAVLSWAQTIGVIAFVGACLALVFAHDHMSQVMGTITRVVLVVSLAVTGVAFMGQLGINNAAGAWLQ